MKIAGVIPARLASTRLPRKVLRDIEGKPLIQHVYERTNQSELLDKVYVATPDKEIIKVVSDFGGNSILTGPHPTVLDRCSEAAEHLNKLDYDLIVVVQGDEPLVKPEMIDLVLRPNYSSLFITCLIKKLNSSDDPWNPNTVKVIKNKSDSIIYLSRSVIPGVTPEKYDTGNVPIYKQVCVMGFRIKQLINFGKMDMGPLEQSEGIDLVRYPENGIFLIKAIESPFETQAVDTAEDLEKVRRIIRYENNWPSK